MRTYNLQTHSRKLLADTITPVSIYLRLRDEFPNSLLLESSDYHANDKSFSFICCNPIASIKVNNNEIIRRYPDGPYVSSPITKDTNVVEELDKFAKSFSSSSTKYKFINNGLFGYLSYDAVKYFEDVLISKKEGDLMIPEAYYAVYQNIIAINHFNNEAYIFCHSLDGKDNTSYISEIIRKKTFAQYDFQIKEGSTTSISDHDFKVLVEKCKEHCQRGDVFQVVPSKRFSQPFSGDEFNVYRALRSINPSPYLFYFDYGSFKIFGSSPEAHLIIQDYQAEIHPIAGTFKRTGNDEQDALLAKALSSDKKENSEHVMLVDLARNDLSRNGHDVQVETYREVQFFSHVIHLVSKVIGKLDKSVNTMRVVADTFPAGTLSGAPKHRALQLLEKYELVNRDFYGGAIGFMDFNGNFNHAIIIRSFLSKNHCLHYQAGAGIVASSEAEKELEEVYNKLRALNKALEIAETIKL